MIPNDYKKGIVDFLGEKGQLWLDQLPQLIENYSQKWQINDLKTCDLSYNFVARGMSAIYGDVVLKICLPGHEYFTEKEALLHLNTELMCQLIDSDDQNYVFLLEAISSYDDLWTVEGVEERLKIAGPLIDAVPTTYTSEVFPTHEQWIDKIYKFLCKKLEKNHAIVLHLDNVKNFYPLLDVHENPRMLLHGDLHHYNILKGSRWYVIDPKGAIGFKSLEVGRYMNNQIQEVGIDQTTTLQLMVKQFSVDLKISPFLILLSFYIDMVLSTAWNFEDEVINYANVNNKVKLCDWVLEVLHDTMDH